MKKKSFIYYLAGYPVSGKIVGRISGQISIRYNPSNFNNRLCMHYVNVPIANEAGVLELDDPGVPVLGEVLSLVQVVANLQK